MEALTVSPKFQVVIPKAIRERLNLVPGQKIQAFDYDSRIELIPEQAMRQMKGFLRGMPTDIEREDDRV